MSAPWISDHWQVQFVDIAPKLVVTGTIEMLCTGIGIKPVGQPVVNRQYMTTAAPRCFQDDNLKPPFHELISATKTGNASAGHDYLLVTRLRRGYRRTERRSRSNNLDSSPPVHEGIY